MLKDIQNLYKTSITVDLIIKIATIVIINNKSILINLQKELSNWN